MQHFAFHRFALLRAGGQAAQHRWHDLGFVGEVV